jgi:hypothetical protein
MTYTAHLNILSVFIFSVPTIERQLVLGEKEAMRARSGGLGTKCMLTPTQISRAKCTQFMGHLQMKEWGEIDCRGEKSNRWAGVASYQCRRVCSITTWLMVSLCIPAAEGRIQKAKPLLNFASVEFSYISRSCNRCARCTKMGHPRLCIHFLTSCPKFKAVLDIDPQKLFLHFTCLYFLLSGASFLQLTWELLSMTQNLCGWWSVRETQLPLIVGEF